MVDKAKVLDATETAFDNIEETLETLERIPKANLNGTTKKQQWVIIGVTAGVSVLLGGGASYLFFKKRFEKQFKLYYKEVSNREIAEARRYYASRSKRDEYADPTEVLERVKSEEETKAKDKIARTPEKNEFAENTYSGRVGALDYTSDDKSETQEPPELLVVEVKDRIKNVFTESEPVGDFDYEVEIPKRTPDEPYVLHYDEFYENDKEFQQVSVTFYEEDGVLVDEREQPFADSEASVGDVNLTRFGYGSKDPNIVYIRNERLEMDFEIARASGSYVQEVLGFRHSDDDGPRKFRRDRE
jgi:flagellar basal body-associated protein FliL